MRAGGIQMLELALFTPNWAFFANFGVPPA
jgi:hypothetical protein